MAGAPLAAPEMIQMSAQENLPFTTTALDGSAAQEAYARLASMDVLQMKQLRQLLEALTGFEQNNKYVLRDGNGTDVFFLKEGSTCIERNCCSGDCKAWRIDFFLLGPQGVAGGVDSMRPFMHIERPCTCTCLCLNRPQIIVTELPSNRVLGYIEDVFTFFRLHFQIKDPNEVPILELKMCPCVPGLCCPCPCDGAPCQTVHFGVADAQSGAEVATLEKLWMWGDCCQCLGEWDNYKFTFGNITHPDYKVLLIALGVFVQMRFFDKRNQQN
jgi:hypothetical protein